ncbi:hypothetical protein EVAR_8281_1 [Eumeta japonica]|uniref:Integrase catalytic domain-containing protein n=1 Tax=Eumeta variegata TaxID=151549 RepID=A0A4C1YB34_EUMVA|nr:hypothetical protein EVAR_8281_1 [Eumeta japonica]
MIARRGYPTWIYSDNGTNLHGADRELIKAMREETSKRSIVWKCIPSGASFMGSAWERLDVEWKSCIRYLGIHIDRSLRMIPQVDYAIQQSQAVRAKLRPRTHVRYA